MFAFYIGIEHYFGLYWNVGRVKKCDSASTPAALAGQKYPLTNTLIYREYELFHSTLATTLSLWDYNKIN